MKARIALVVSHPIQHFCPQYVSFATNEHISFKVFFASTLGLSKYIDPNFQKEISWGNLHLEKFNHTFLNGDQLIKSDKNIDASLLEAALEEFNPDVVVIYGYFQKLQRRAYKWATRNRVSLAYISDSELRHSRNWLKKLIQYFLLRKFFSRISYFLSVGNANEEFYKYYGVKDSQLLRMHFPIDVKMYSLAFENKLKLNEQIRAQYGIASDSIVLSVVGKLVSWKNQDHVIDALYVLERKGIILDLFVIGSGPMLDQWKKKVSSLTQSHVHFTGFIPVEDLPSYYAATDIYVHPASIEPHSIAISEAIFMGCPVVLSDTCGSFGETDDVTEGENGLIFPFGDIDALAGKIRLLVESEKLRNDSSQDSINRSRRFQQIAHRDVLIELNSRLVKSPA